MEIEKIETADLIGAVIGAVSGPNAAVVRHLVETFLAMGGGIHRTDLFARGIVAVLAVDGKKILLSLLRWR